MYRLQIFAQLNLFMKHDINTLIAQLLVFSLFKSATYFIKIQYTDITFFPFKACADTHKGEVNSHTHIHTHTHAQTHFLLIITLPYIVSLTLYFYCSILFWSNHYHDFAKSLKKLDCIQVNSLFLLIKSYCKI